MTSNILQSVTRGCIINLCKRTCISCGLLPKRNMITVGDETVMKTSDNNNGYRNSEELHVSHDDERINEENEKSSSKSAHISFYMPTIRIPPELDSALRTVLTNYSSKSLMTDGIALAKYLVRRGRKSHLEKELLLKRVKNLSSIDEVVVDNQFCKPDKFSTIRYRTRECVAFAASRLPACYGATLRVLQEIATRLPKFRPKTLLDFGSGIGTSVWAANQIWGETVTEYQCIDISSDAIDFSELLFKGGDPNAPPVISDIYYRQFLPISNRVNYDVVIASYSLHELPNIKLRQDAIKSLWKKTKEFLIIVEPGNNDGFDTILHARNIIVNMNADAKKNGLQKGHVFAPCPHDIDCPREYMDVKSPPCFFEQRVEVSLTQRDTHLKYSCYPERFSYVVIRKGKRNEDALPYPRVVKPPRYRTGHVICDLCLRDGFVEELIFSKSEGKELYKALKCSRWGDILECDVAVADHDELLQEGIELYEKEHGMQADNQVEKIEEQIEENES